MSVQEPYVPDFRPPSKRAAKAVMAGYKAYFRPRFWGLENVSQEQPALLVGNHTIYGALDAPLLVHEIYQQTGVFVRWLGDRFHFVPPIWRDIIWASGTVEGSHANCLELMRQKQSIGVFPGGGREVAKRRGEAYKLLWKERTGFARIAIQGGYPIVPFAAVGAEECFDIVYDGNDFKESRIGKLALRSPQIHELLRGGEMFMPIARGIGLTGIPRPSPMYFKLGEPIAFEGNAESEDDIWEYRETVRVAVESLLFELKEIRAKDRSSLSLPRKILNL